MRATLDAIVTKFKYPNARKSAEPTYTLELTGPGIFTDAIKAAGRDVGIAPRGGSTKSSGGSSGGDSGDVGGVVAATAASPPPPLLFASSGGNAGVGESGGAAADELPLLHISRLAGHRYFRHVGQGSWKTYRLPSLSGVASGRAPVAKVSLDPHEVRFLLVFLLLATLAATSLHCASRYAAAAAALHAPP